VEIKQCTVDEFFAHPGASALLAEYAAESAIAGMPTPNPNAERYAVLVQAGAAVPLVAFDGDDMLGFLVLLVALNPHYSAVIGVVESIFVASARRKTGAGLRLLREAENLAQSRGAVGFLVSAPLGGRFAEVLEAHGAYRETNRIFFRGFA
jgi:GNAT superfamily N-acetyltransferase